MTHKNIFKWRRVSGSFSKTAKFVVSRKRWRKFDFKFSKNRINQRNSSHVHRRTTMVGRGNGGRAAMICLLFCHHHNSTSSGYTSLSHLAHSYSRRQLLYARYLFLLIYQYIKTNLSVSETLPILDSSFKAAFKTQTGLSELSVFRPHRLHVIHRWGLLLQMSYVAWSVCLSVWMLGARMSCVKTAEPIEMPFGRLTHVDLRKHVLDGSKERTNPFVATRVDKTATRPFAT